MFMMQDMAKTPEEIQEDQEPAPLEYINEYPYGLCISLGEDEITKLGIDPEDMPMVGHMIHIMAMAKVTSISAHDSAEGSCRRIELQITNMALEDEDDQTEMASTRAVKRYGT